jgi:hypothetical protein
VHFYTASIAHANGETTRRQIAANDFTEARKSARQIASSLGDVSSVEVWKN